MCAGRTSNKNAIQISAPSYKNSTTPMHHAAAELGRLWQINFRCDVRAVIDRQIAYLFISGCSLNATLSATHYYSY